MANGVKIGSGVVDVTADMSNFDNAMAALPKKASARMAEVMNGLQARIAQTKLDLKFAYNSGDLEAQQRLIPVLENLRAKADAVSTAATRQAQAIQDAARASVQAAAAAQAQAAATQAQAHAADEASRAAAQQLAQQQALLAANKAVAAQQQAQAAHAASLASSPLPVGPRDPRQTVVFQNLGDDAYAAVKKLEAMGAAGGKAGQQVKQGGMGGAMGLMVLSQALDDVQYGFRAIVNNIPMMGMALGSVLGMSSELATKFGAIAGIAAVAINFIINHWDQMFQRFGYGTDTMKQVWISVWGETKDVAITALDAIEARIKELEAKPIKMAVDMHELEEAKKELEELKAGKAAWEQMGKGSNPFEKESGEKIKGLFSEMGAKEVQRLQEDLVNKRAGDASANSPAVLREHLTPADEAKARKGAIAGAMGSNALIGGVLAGPLGAAIGGNLGLEAPKEAQDAAVEAERKRRADEAGKVRQANQGKASLELGVILSKAQGGNAAAQEQLIKALEGIGRHGLAGQVRALSPEAAADAANARAGKAASDADKAKAARVQAEEKEFDENASDTFKGIRDKEASRFAGAMGPTVGKGLLRNPGMSEQELQQQIAKAMTAAGIAGDVISRTLGETAKKIREATEKEVQERAMARGITKDEAASQLAREQQDREREQASQGRPKAELTTTEDYLNKLLVASVSGGKPDDSIPKDQLKAQQDAVAKLEEVRQAVMNSKAAAGPAQFARGR